MASKRLLGYGKTTHRFLNASVQSVRTGTGATIHGCTSVEDTRTQARVPYTERSPQHPFARVTDLGRALCVKNSGIFGWHGRINEIIQGGVRGKRRKRW